ncbi:trimethylguanosine synthase-like [Acyrthosiphon pisum]|uniref:Trimethylguanosine synthase n=1 Tax=Acyrthosiphon pisum TaxID=7029 RepID=A0A8R2JMZ9_ACYPI|nr:trimethylguanosine synthase-like [Acyrthosiphon pisum]
MDEESFYSVCPEKLCAYMAEQCGRVKVAVDPFCGAGGNVIHLARRFDKGTVIFFALKINKTVFVEIK